ncbi:hypothetical protein AMATHDRAFT_46840 [Amanita thiersii Skay4041]|uniref:Uncharacterized protein n=1 Tax=Amanita thiersii Skay4041 TaxID=703135 RepID=A0A2A9NVG9_9AGAR|nr:hypothetical protein AMATHDRAFT_46840 [Amanita thiersii Skay4041]
MNNDRVIDNRDPESVTQFLVQQATPPVSRELEKTRERRQREINLRIQDAQRQIDRLANREIVRSEGQQEGRIVAEQENERLQEQIQILREQIEQLQVQQRLDRTSRLGSFEDLPPAYAS